MIWFLTWFEYCHCYLKNIKIIVIFNNKIMNLKLGRYEKTT